MNNSGPHKKMRKQGALAFEVDDKAPTTPEHLKIVIHLNRYADRVAQTPVQYNRREKDTLSHKTKMQPGKDQSPPPKKLRRNETKEEKTFHEWNCGNCTHSFSAWEDLKAHVNSEHKTTPKKPHKNTKSERGHCGKTISSTEQFQRHMRTAHSMDVKTKPECGRCGKSFSTQSNLNIHMRTVHSTHEKTRPECGRCGKSFSTQSNLNIHMRTVHSTHEKTRPECGRCGKSFSTQSNLNIHMRTVHSTHEKTRPECGRCGKSFSTQSNLNIHMRTVHSTHEKTRPECGRCGKSLSTQSNLNIHMRTVHSTHEKTRPECGRCGKSFSTKSNLNIHMRTVHSTHEKTRPECGRCGKSFSTQSNLNIHMRTVHSTHEKTKRRCRQCEKSFSSPQKLRRHIKMAHSPHDNTRRQCGRCGKSFCSTGNLNRHVKMEHSAEPPKDAAVPEKTGVMEENLHLGTQRVPVTKFTKYKCRCGKIEDTYDASVRHAQEHLVQLDALIRENGTQCELKFNRHNRGNKNSQSLIQTKFDYKALLKDSWFNMFKPTKWSSTILESSLYKDTRCVKLNWDSEKREEREGHCVPLYKCGACNLFVEPAKIQNHCENYRACVDFGPQGHECLECHRYFYTAKALSLHEEDHKTHKDLRFKIVTFNNEGDVQFNKALRQMSVLFAEDTQTMEQEEISREPETPKINTLNKTNVQHTFHNDVEENVVVPVVKYCAQCRSYYSAMNKYQTCPSCTS